MDLVGTKIRKNFQGFGIFTGVIQSYDAAAGYFKIVYEDGDSEDLELEEIELILKEMSGSSPNFDPNSQRRGRGRPPKKQRLLDSNLELYETLGGEKVIPLGRTGRRPNTDDGELNLAVNSRYFSVLENGCSKNEVDETLVSGKVTPLRRSGRRASMATECENTLISEDDELGGDAKGDLSMPELPPSSNDLDLDGLNVLDLFSAYTCLRSFSRLLFLSPFRLDTFVAALRCDRANFLIDSVHFSLLQSLKQRLESLSEEGSQSASDCLRYLNWELLDLITWPVFLVHYLLAHVSITRPGFSLSQLKLLDLEYYKQSSGVKLEILRYLCDDVIEVDAIRSELHRRMGSEINADASCVILKVDKKRKSSASIEPERYTAEEGSEEIDDGNIDECCLCGMDGSLICCDGCPAAFHSRCVGVVKDLLPEGEWYCPECSVEKSDGLIKSSKPSYGAEFLGIDPHGRLYFGSCDHLLVSDSCESDASYHYYNKNDTDAVITSLKSCYAYSDIVNAISIYCGFPVDASASNNQYCNEIRYLKEDLEVQVQPMSLLTSKHNVIGDGNAERLPVENSASCEQCDLKSFQVSDLVHLNSVISQELVGINCPFSCAEPLAENGRFSAWAQVSQQAGTEHLIGSFSPNQVISLKHTDLTAASDELMDAPGGGCITNRKKAGTLDLPTNPDDYINYYCFGRIASSIYVEFVHKSSEGNNNESKKPVEDIKSAQLQAICSKSDKGCCYTYQKLFIDVQKENCGWCFSCKTSSDSGCLFKVVGDKNLKGSKDKDLEGSKRPTIGPRSENNKKSHITSAVHHILSIEGRARSLLSGPWLKPHYSQQWREAVMKASDVESLKPLLLILELNLRRIALLAEWSKPVDDARAIVSASIVTSPVHASSNYGSRRKQGKKNISGVETNITSHHAKIMDIYWWRGGRLSHQVFQCKMLPRALAFKGGRQAGRRKIPHILYPESVDFAKRSKYVSWRVAVEMSKSVAQLVYQVKDFDSNIKWSELFDTRPFPKLAKESKKMARLMKKVTICGKHKEGTRVKYLLDFGKRETVPAVVTKNGVLFQESTSERKKYWLSEAHVPLNLLKSYEEKNIRKKIARLLKKTDPGTHIVNESECKTKKRAGKHAAEESEFKTKKRKRSEGLAYLISREQNSEKQLCGQCNEDVLVREAAKCQICDGLFHRKHFRASKGSIATTYKCSKCRNTKNMNANDKDTKSVKAKDKVIKSMNLMSKATGSVNKKTKGIKSAKEKDEKNWNLRDREVRSMNLTDRDGSYVSKKAKGSQNVNTKQWEIKRWNLRERSTKIMNVKCKGIRSERVHRKDIASLIVNVQGHKTVSTRKNSDDKMLETVPEKKKYFLRKNKMKYYGLKRCKKGRSKSRKSKKCDYGITWHKRKRSVVHHSYWLNGLLWARKPVTEQQRYFRERNVILPFQHTEDVTMKHLCCLCNKEYNFGALYICCEHCQDWFHGDALHLTVENINNLVGFRCHRCCMRSEPVCPFLGADLDTDCEVGADVVCNNRQIDEGKHCDGSIVCEEDYLDGDQREGACVEHQKGKYKDHGNLHEDCSVSTVHSENHVVELQSVNGSGEKLVLYPNPLLTNGYIGGLQHVNDLEKSHGGGCEDHLNIVQTLDHTDEEQ